MVMEDLIRDALEFVIAVGDLIALFRVGLQDLPFLIRELARLVQDFQGNSDLADIVQKAQQRQVALLNVRQTDAFPRSAPILWVRRTWLSVSLSHS